METVASALKRTDITTVASTNRGCVRLLAHSKKSTKQRIVTGDMQGHIKCFSVGKSLDVKSEFPVEYAPFPKAVTRITIHNDARSGDQIFVASGATVTAMNKKGTSFFQLQTNMSDDIRLLCVRSPFLYIGGLYTMTAFQESAEKGFYMAPDRMNDADLDPMEAESAASAGAVLGCQDRMLRRVHHGAVTSELPCEAPVSAVGFERGNSNATKPQHRTITYGTAAGTVGCVGKPQALSEAGTLVPRWSWIPSEKGAAVSAVMHGPSLSQSGVPDVIVAREDGSVEVFQCAIPSGPDGAAMAAAASAAQQSPLQKLFTASMGELVSGLDAGFVTNAESEDVVVSTFSGKVVALSPPGANDMVVPATAGSGAAVATGPRPAALNSVTDEGLLPQAQQLKIEQTLKEIADLQRKLQDTKVSQTKLQQQVQQLHAKKAAAQTPAEKQQQQQLQEPLPSGALNVISKAAGTSSTFALHDRFFLDDATGELVILTELDVPLGSVAVDSEVPLLLNEVGSDACSICAPADVVPVAGAAAKPQTMMGVGGGSEHKKPEFLGVFRCGTADSTGMPKKLEIRFRVDEGKYGALTATVQALDNSHGATVCTYKIPALSRHVRLAPAEIPQVNISASDQFAKLDITGAFSLKEVHLWLSGCMMEVPERVVVTAAPTVGVAPEEQQPQIVTYHFRNTFLSSILVVHVAKGQLVAYSQNASTLTALRDHITRCATQRKIAVRIDAAMKPEAVDVVIWLGIDAMRGLSVLQQRYALVDALKELQSQEQDVESFLAPELMEILNNSKELHRAARLHDKKLGEVQAYLSSWLRDSIVFAGSPASSSLEQAVVQFQALMKHQPLTPDVEQRLRVFCRDICFPPEQPSSSSHYQYHKQQQHHNQHQNQNQLPLYQQHQQQQIQFNNNGVEHDAAGADGGRMRSTFDDDAEFSLGK